MDGKHAFVVGGTQSGCGKTTLTLAILAAYRARGLTVQPFKVGPDFIDPGLHAQMAGLSSRNLDGWMLSREYNQGLFQSRLARADLGVVEGVMGLFDGYDGTSESGSTAEMAKWLGLPVVLVVDARSMARSAAALVYGFSRFDPGLRVAGVLFNRLGGPGHLEYLKEAMAANLPEIPVLGGIPREDLIGIPERHLGLVTADETPLHPERKEKLVELMERYVDLDLLLERSVYPPGVTPRETGAGGRLLEAALDLRGVSPPSMATQQPISSGGNLHEFSRQAARPVIAVARDAAFCFYYVDNFELLGEAGAQLQFFSPLAGETVPREADGLYLGGGYPELFAQDLSERTNFLESIRGAAGEGMPIYAECGGLMVLGRFIETLEGKRFAMAGVFPFATRMLSRRKALGYTEVVLREPCLLGYPGLTVRGHEFHYSEIVEEENAAVRCVYELRRRKYSEARPEGYQVGSVLASYIHLHWGSAPKAARSFVMRCREYAKGRERHRADVP